MSEVWFTSDLHVGHRFVAKIRGFESVEEHDQALFDNWNSLIQKDDQVWVLGDVAVSKPAVILESLARLPGQKHLIAGNHDGCHPMHRDSHRRQAAYLETFESVQTFARRKIGGRYALLSHFPYTADHTSDARYTQYRLPDEGLLLLHGHTHGREQLHGHEVHVGLDAWGHAPVNLSVIEMLASQIT